MAKMTKSQLLATLAESTELSKKALPICCSSLAIWAERAQDSVPFEVKIMFKALVM
jgi:hypothetical protein